MRRILATVIFVLSSGSDAFCSQGRGVDIMDKRILLVFMIFAVVLILGLLYFVRLAFKTYRSEKNRDSDKESKVSFMVNTFHELVQKLKDKEGELDELRRRAEERAEDVESYNENILQSVPSGVVSFDSDLRVTRINASAEKILSVSSDQCIGRKYDEIFDQQISNLILNKDSLLREEVIYESPSHSRLWLGLTIWPLKNKEGSPIGKIIVFTDLTDLKALESQMKLRENLSNLGELSAGIAHELRNPMGVIAGYTRILSKKVTGELGDTVEAINKEIGMMDRIITDFMSFSHPLNINKTTLDVSHMVEEITRSLKPEDRNINVNLSLGECTVEGDETLMRQVFTNLIQNSVEAMREGGELIIRSRTSGSSVSIEITDTGHGISNEIKNKIFLPFYTTKEKGTGLGLAIVHKIIISHGGNISFTSSEEGTTFRTVLPGPD